jgi:hypothetical protein
VASLRMEDEDATRLGAVWPWLAWVICADGPAEAAEGRAEQRAAKNRSSHLVRIVISSAPCRCAACDAAVQRMPAVRGG